MHISLGLITENIYTVEQILPVLQKDNLCLGSTLCEKFSLLDVRPVEPIHIASVWNVHCVMGEHPDTVFCPCVTSFNINYSKRNGICKQLTNDFFITFF